MIAVHVLASQANRAGGADVYTRELAMRLPARGFRTTLVCLEADDEVRAACDTRIVDRGRTNDWPLLWRFSPVLQVASVKSSMRALRLDPPDVVLGMAHQLIWAHTSVFGPRPLVYLPHSMVAPVEVASYRWGSGVKRAVAMWFWRRIERDCLNRASRTVRFTRTACAVLEEYYGAAVSPRFQVIPQAVDIGPPPERQPRSGFVRLLWVGRLVESKNVRFLLDTVARLQCRNWTLDVLGDGEERPALEEFLRARQLGDRVRFYGHVPPADFYSRADLLVSASRLENAPLVILEAMSYGVPTLTMRPDGRRYLNANDEMIDDGRDGFLARDEADFGAQLERLIDSRPALEAAGREARRTVEARHSWTAHLDAYERMLKDVVRDARSGRASRLNEDRG